MRWGICRKYLRTRNSPVSMKSSPFLPTQTPFLEDASSPGPTLTKVSQLQTLKLCLYGPQHLRVWLGLHPARSYASTSVALVVIAITTWCFFGRIGREYGFAFVACVMRDRAGSEFVSGIPEGVLVLLWRVSRAVRAVDV